MFGGNQIVGKKFFADAPADSLMVTSMFMTIQGEGPYTGLPAYFIRLSKCNLNCHFCDAFFDRGEYYSFNQILNKIEEEWPKTCNVNERLIVLTGGEPLLQNNLVNFVRYVEEVAEDRYKFQIETNGTQDPYDLWASSVKIVCSPKVSEKTGKYLNMNEDYLEHIDCLKFVISADPESPYHTIPDWAKMWRNQYWYNEIYISPMNVYKKLPDLAKGTGDLGERSTKDEVMDFWSQNGVLDLEQNEKNHKYAAQYCIENGYRLNLQQHIYVGLA